jgi:hypothetical protein
VREVTVNASIIGVGTLSPIYNEFIFIYQDDKSLSRMALDNLTFPYYEKLLELLRPWSVYLDSNHTSHIDSLDEDQINHTLAHFTQTEHNMGEINGRRNEFNLAEEHCQRALSYARLFDGIRAED